MSRDKPNGSFTTGNRQIDLPGIGSAARHLSSFKIAVRILKMHAGE
jgi:hypothetical protein